tara:strand:+ start:195 stop:794 length:600 start_codon:yes stop_codon:yes gene_type:complete
MACVTNGNRPSFSLLLALRRVISNTNATKALVWRLNDEAFDLTLSTARFTDLDVNNEAITFVRRRSRELFAGNASKGRVIASNIAFAAAVLGAEHVDINEDTDWWIVASETDWMYPRPPSFNDCLELFDRIVPFPEQGPTSHRPEIYAAAYAEHAYVQREGVVTTLVGPPVTPPEPHQSIIPPWCTNVLAFRTDRISDP